jgi:hypothetical protein
MHDPPFQIQPPQKQETLEILSEKTVLSILLEGECDKQLQINPLPRSKELQ